MQNHPLIDANKKLLSRQEAAYLLGMSLASLDRSVKAGTGPIPTRVGIRGVRFTPAALDTWIESQTIAS